MQEWIKEASKFSVNLTQRQVEQFGMYQKLLQEWNEKINLTAIKSDIEIQQKHFLDSLTCSPAIRKMNAGRIIDIGSGAGFPGIPLKIVHPEISFILIDSIGKKVDFCNLVIRELGLSGINAIKARAEESGNDPKFREKFDISIARAVARMSILMEYLLPLVRIGGIAIAQKGRGAHEETQSAEKAIRLLGGRLQHISEIEYSGLVDERYLVIVDKIAATPDGYPRIVGVPGKKPL